MKKLHILKIVKYRGGLKMMTESVKEYSRLTCFLKLNVIYLMLICRTAAIFKAGLTIYLGRSYVVSLFNLSIR